MAKQKARPVWAPPWCDWTVLMLAVGAGLGWLAIGFAAGLAYSLAERLASAARRAIRRVRCVDAALSNVGAKAADFNGLSIVYLLHYFGGAATRRD
jgi:hypothetical protein